MKTSLNKNDIIWGYLSKGMSISSGVITLPLILKMLNEEEIAMNYIFITLMSIVLLFDFGFSPQFARNFAFVFGGAQEITSVGEPRKVSDQINYRLLSNLISTARSLYLYLTIGVASLLLVFGTAYIYVFTEGFTLVDNSLAIWLIFSLSVCIDFYYRYFTPLLMGAGKVAEVNRIEVYATSLKIIILVLCLYCGMGLWSVIISNFIRVIIVRVLSVKSFYTDDMKRDLGAYNNDQFNKYSLVKKLWYNAKRAMFVSVATYISTQLSFFYTGLFLSKSEVASYGLLTQLAGIITMLSMSISQFNIPFYSTLRTQRDLNKLKETFYLTLGSYYYIFIIGSLFLIIVIPYFLGFIGSNALLPVLSVSTIYLLYKFLENQHIVCTHYLTSQNKIVDFESACIIGFANLIMQTCVLKFTEYGLLGLVFIQFFVPLCYPNWKWPYEICKEFNVTYPVLVKNSLVCVINKGVQYLKK